MVRAEVRNRMATPTFAIQRILRTQRQLDASPEAPKSSPRKEYEEILVAVHQLADEETHDDLMGWVIVEAVHKRKVPAAAELRKRARAICQYRGIEIPKNSALSE